MLALGLGLDLDLDLQPLTPWHELTSLQTSLIGDDQ